MGAMKRTGRIAGMGLLLIGIFCLLYLHGAWYRMSDENLVVLATTYREGFLSAGFVGSVYGLLNRILPYDLMTYETAYGFTKCMLGIYFLLAAGLLVMVYHKTAEEQKKKQMDLICLALILFGGMFGSGNTMGSFDMYQMIVFLLCMFPLFTNRGLWLLLPLSVVGMCIHPSFLFKNLPLILLLLTYLCKKGEPVSSKKRKGLRNGILVVCLLLFIVSEVSVILAGDRMAEIEGMAALLSQNPEGFDAGWMVRGLRILSAVLPEWGYHHYNYLGLLFFLIFFSPYLWIGRKFFLGVNEKVGWDREYRLLQFGALALLPEFLFKVCYGYLIYEVIVYYLVLLMFFIVVKDQKILGEMEQMLEKIRNRMPVPILLLLYPVLFIPFNGETIFFVFEKIARMFGV